MTPFSRSIIHTLAFYDAVGSVALTKIELYKYLVVLKETPSLSFGNFLKALDEEWIFLKSRIGLKRGFYFLKTNVTAESNSASAYRKRIHIGKTGIEKWRIAKQSARLISFIPYVRMVAVTGSLALNSTTKDSDIDVLIAAKSGHIWTVRVLVSMLMQALGKRRYGKFIRDRICLNHYISDNETALRPEHLFSKHICSTLVPVWRQESYTPYFLKKISAHLKTMAAGPRLLYSLRNIIEYALSIAVARKIESVFRAIQTHRIKGREFIADDKALVFHHPRPQNQEALYLYQKNLRHLGLS